MLLSQFIIQFKIFVRRFTLEKQTLLVLIFLIPDITCTHWRYLLVSGKIERRKTLFYSKCAEFLYAAILQILQSHFPSHSPSKLHTIATFRTLYTLTLYTLMYLRIVNCVDTEKGFLLQNSAAENLFSNSCPMQSNKFIGSLSLPELLTHSPLYTGRLIRFFIYIRPWKSSALFETGPFTPGGSSKLITCSDTY